MLNVDAFYTFAVISKAIQWDDHIFVDLERIGMGRDGCSTRSGCPELLSSFSTDSNEAFGATRVYRLYNRRCCAGYGLVIFTDNIGKQQHFR